MEDAKELISCEGVIARVRNMLSTFDEQGLLNQQVMYGWVREVLDRLGLSGLAYYEEVIPVTNNTAWLPERIKNVEAIYSVEPEDDSSKLWFQDYAGYIQGHGVLPGLQVDGDSVTQISWYKQKQIAVRFNTPRLLPVIIKKSLPFGLDSTTDEFVSRDGRKLTSFGNTHKAFYIQYYGVPVDEEGVPLIPDTETMLRAVRTFLIFRFFEKAWFNSEVPDIQNKYQKAEMDFKQAMFDAIREAKLPSFSAMINMIRKSRRRFDTYRQLTTRHPK